MRFETNKAPAINATDIARPGLSAPFRDASILDALDRPDGAGSSPLPKTEGVNY